MERIEQGDVANDVPLVAVLHVKSFVMGMSHKQTHPEQTGRNEPLLPHERWDTVPGDSPERQRDS